MILLFANSRLLSSRKPPKQMYLLLTRVFVVLVLPYVFMCAKKKTFIGPLCVHVYIDLVALPISPHLVMFRLPLFASRAYPQPRAVEIRKTSLLKEEKKGSPPLVSRPRLVPCLTYSPSFLSVFGVMWLHLRDACGTRALPLPSCSRKSNKLWMKRKLLIKLLTSKSNTTLMRRREAIVVG